jgi:nucleotide-binding universal stress UspA family protein
MIESILIATDGSDAASAAERFGVALAARLRARLHGVTVIEDRLLQGLRAEALGVQAPSVEGIEGFLRARAEAVTRRVGELARQNGLECKVDGVLRKTAKPALVVPVGAELGGPLVLGFDGSPGSRIAAKLAVELAGRLEQAIHCFVDSKDKGRAVARFDEVRRLVGTISVPVREASSTLGRPDVKLVDTARAARAGLIVMGAFGRNRINEYFLGSNATAVTRSSPVAVLLAR